MWRSVAIGVVLAGMLAGCGAGSGALSDPHSANGSLGPTLGASGTKTYIVGTSDTFPSDGAAHASARFEGCLQRNGASVIGKRRKGWKIRFHDGRSLVFLVPWLVHGDVQNISFGKVPGSDLDVMFRCL
jgi:hypothetical protein